MKYKHKKPFNGTLENNKKLVCMKNYSTRQQTEIEIKYFFYMIDNIIINYEWWLLLGVDTRKYKQSN